MIVFVVTSGHSYTHQAVVGADPGLSVEFLFYGDMAKLKALPRATYIFGDMDRLPTEVLRIAGKLYRQLKDQGLRVLNDPARVLSRYGLLRRLNDAGLNDFNAYRAEEGTPDCRWPAFLRTDGDHITPLPELYESRDSLEQGIAKAVASGIPLSRLLVVEFAAETVRPGLYRKFSSFQIGSLSVAHTCVHDSDWIAKDGKLGICPPELYDEEYRIVCDNPYGPALARVFEIAGVDYGRIDFGVLNGRVQVYEINTNPHMKFGAEHPAPIRVESYGVFRRNYLNALKAIDTPGTGARGG